MTIRILKKERDGTTSVSTLTAKWHPETSAGPAGIYVTANAVREHVRRINDRRASYGCEMPLDAEKMIKSDGIVCAEAPLEIYDDTDDGEPYRHYGTLYRSIPGNPTQFDLVDHDV